MFRRIVFAACLGGLVAGLVLTLVQKFHVTPIILEAEKYETVEPAAAGHEHDNADVHHHGEAWAPGDGWERTLWTAVSNIGMAVGFGLLLVAFFSLRDKVTVAQGVLWGLGGYAIFFESPVFGLTPEIPGAEAVALGLRQGWWLAAVVLSGMGLAMLVFTKHWGLKICGVALIALPHIIGAPHPAVAGGNAPETLAQSFVIASAFANAIFWLVLGASSAYAFRRLA